jgi:hypothetical protein
VPITRRPGWVIGAVCAAVAVVIAIVAVAANDDGGSSAAPTSVTVAPTVLPTTTLSPPLPSANVDIAEVRRRCAISELEADLDGDGKPDRALHTSIGYDVVLAVCTGAGQVITTPGLAMAELQELTDLNADGTPELLYGGTSVCGGGENVAVLVGGALRPVVGSDGQPLELTGGCNGGPDWGNADAWGCSGPDVVQVRARVDNSIVRWTRDVIHVDGTSARLVKRDSGVDSTPIVDGYEVPASVKPTPCPSPPAAAPVR